MSVQIYEETYPGTILGLGDENNFVLAAKVALNDIATNYPAIPRITPVDSVFDETMEAAVREFQSIFNLPVTGYIDKATWYEIAIIHAAVLRLVKLSGIGVAIGEATEDIGEVQVTPRVQLVQFFLNVLSVYYSSIPPVDIDGILGHLTRTSIMEFQKTFGLPVTGIIDNETWDSMYNSVLGIFRELPPNAIALPSLIYPNIVFSEGSFGAGVLVIQELLAFISTRVPEIPNVTLDGLFGPETKASVTAFQRMYGLEEDGIVGKETWNSMVSVYRNLRYSENQNTYTIS